MKPLPPSPKSSRIQLSLKHQTGQDDDELLRRASRMEELGFHVGIVPEQMRQTLVIE